MSISHRRMNATAGLALLATAAMLAPLCGCGKPSAVKQPGPGHPGTTRAGGAASRKAPAVLPVSLLGKTRSEIETKWGPGKRGSEAATKKGGTIVMYAYRPAGSGAISAGFVDDRLVLMAIHLVRPVKSPDQALSAVGLTPAQWKATATPGFPYVPDWRWKHQPAPDPDAPAQAELRLEKPAGFTRVKVFTQEALDMGTGQRALGPEYPPR